MAGRVEYRSAPQAGWGTASLGQTLIPGGQIRTADESRASIRFAEGGLLRLGPNSVFTLTQKENVPLALLARLGLATHEVFVFIFSLSGSGLFDTNTPSGVASVRG